MSLLRTYASCDRYMKLLRVYICKLLDQATANRQPYCLCNPLPTVPRQVPNRSQNQGPHFRAPPNMQYALTHSLTYGFTCMNGSICLSVNQVLEVGWCISYLLCFVFFFRLERSSSVYRKVSGLPASIHPSTHPSPFFLYLSIKTPCKCHLPMRSNVVVT